jgi:hypothetical protein
MGALRSMDPSLDYRLKFSSRGAVFGKLKVLASGNAIVRAKIS